MRTKIDNLQGLRGVAVLLVGFLHLHNFEHIYREDAILPAWARVGHSGVDLFFVISGFIMMAIARDYASNARTAAGFLYNRWARIYPTYWLWFLISLFIFVVAPNWLRMEPGQIPRLVESFFLVPPWSPILVPVAWTLKYELYFYLVFSLIILVPARKRIFALLVWGMYMLAGQTHCYLMPEAQCSKGFSLTIHPLGMEFLFGAFIGWLYMNRELKRPRYILTAGLVLMAGGYALYLFTGLHLDDNVWYRVLLFGIPATVLVYGAVEMERKWAPFVPAWLVTLGNASYTIYLSHFLLLQVFFFLLTKHFSMPIASLDALIVSLVLGVGVAGYLWIERPLLRLCRGRLFTEDREPPVAPDRLVPSFTEKS
jgi:peptidoglycan/LPS O-acetylase OafA/YrhL